MKKYLFLLLLAMVTSVVFSRPVDRPPDIDVPGIEIVCPAAVVLMEVEQSILYLDITQAKPSLEKPQREIIAVEVPEKTSLPRYLKKAGTMNRQDGNCDNTLNRRNVRDKPFQNNGEFKSANIENQPRIRSPVSYQKTIVENLALK